MAKDYSREAGEAWDVLVECAKKKELITYGDLGALVGVHVRQVNRVLGLLQDYCLAEKLLPITIQVINKSYGKPGEGFVAWDIENLDEGVQRVQDYPWQPHGNPFGFALKGATFQNLADRILRNPNEADDVYAKVRVRGQIQEVFRRVLLAAYEGRCAFTGVTFEEGLDACHIVSWSECDRKDRLNPANGILLSSFYHRLFDAGYLTIDESFRVIYCDPKIERFSYTEEDKSLVASLHGKRIYLPKEAKYRPGKEFIRVHNIAYQV
jgi:putative restriction endonuclease